MIEIPVGAWTTPKNANLHIEFYKNGYWLSYYWHQNYANQCGYFMENYSHQENNGS
jgi:hypothetical protein